MVKLPKCGSPEHIAMAMGLGLVGLAFLDTYATLKPESKAKIRKCLKEVLIEQGLIDK